MRWKKTIGLFAARNSSYTNDPITLLLYRSDDEYISMLGSEVQAAAQKAGYKLKILDSKNSTGLQLAQVKAAHNNGEKAIIINLVDPYDAPDILKAAEDTKVIFINRIPSDMSILNKNAIYVGSDNTVAGKFQGEWLAIYFKNKRQDNIKYILLEGTPGLPTTEMRTEGALKALADGGITATPATLPVVANFQRDEALYKIFPLLLSDIEFDTIISNNDAMALGAIEAIEYIGMDPSETPIVGVDATYPAFQALRDGTLAMTVFQDAKAQAETSITSLTNMLKDEPIDKGTGYTISPDNPYAIYIPFEPVTLKHIPQNLQYTTPSNVTN